MDVFATLVMPAVTLLLPPEYKHWPRDSFKVPGCPMHGGQRLQCNFMEDPVWYVWLADSSFLPRAADSEAVDTRSDSVESSYSAFGFPPHAYGQASLSGLTTSGLPAARWT